MTKKEPNPEDLEHVLREQLENIRKEEVPERLLELARELQVQLRKRKQRFSK
ncbi:hypothetical protein SAMN05216196_108156 [Lutimaribacter pacificus]|uniref:Anti-sigma factor NepR domain-containing protein n=1 Tax=Lutimaribacter pacificus TaxID=391948 RepID=A0A1H0LVL3_9RHOB|nr:hypothetical protein [Lutimaribacter pacificus]SDO72238.1 hypothetical protein SAMN05216196_108156 [Lutimaribacter pacificus]SHK02674.1 hypothetical protein SAMN05444142_1031 [Lutimaribacter pacificus]